MVLMCCGKQADTVHKDLVCSLEDMTQEEEVAVVERATKGSAREIQRGI